MKETTIHQSAIKVQVLLTGNELMSGVTIDSNSAMMAEKLSSVGLTLFRKVTIGDEIDVLIDEMEVLSRSSDVIIVNGGLGPTIDDLTAEAVGNLIDKPIVEHVKAMQHLDQWCKARGLALNEANKKQAFLPEGAVIIDNALGSAVGFSVVWNDCFIICTPGVPSELRVMLDQEIIPLLQKRFPHSSAPSITRLQFFGLGESTLQQTIVDTFPDWPKEVDVSFRAGAPTLELKLTTYDESHAALKQQWKDKLLSLVGDCVVGEGSTTLQKEVVALLAEHNKSVTTVESCTGGLIASTLTEVPGASAVFEAGFVTYSNEMKEKLVGVSAKVLQTCGAVSEEVVREMLDGGLKISGADVGVAVSGVAGPDGGTVAKPVGTVWIAWGSDQAMYSQRLLVRWERKMFQVMTAAIALDLIRRLLLGIEASPGYFARYN
ncbi:MAG: CinA family nicotinamide mononucleotide deamidase-related protein [Pseudomonadales bacterium]|nr:CinA family nicotinamide mononucleotide deamidase-related protein [Pseudomonadales bacterium]